jgi:hypothetical protein
MKFDINQVVRVKRFKEMPSGWADNMLVYMGNVVVIRDIDNESYETDVYNVQLKDTFHGINIKRWNWRKLDFEKVNTNRR